MMELPVSDRLYHNIWKAKTKMEIKQGRDIKMSQFVNCLLNAYNQLTGGKEDDRK